MTKLKCDAVNCYYNEEKLCCLDSILVNGVNAKDTESTECASFKERTTATYSNCSCGEHANKELEIECNAKNCNYNDNCRCHANAINICGPRADRCCETECSTFECKC